jgi:hypothetical protein
LTQNWLDSPEGFHHRLIAKAPEENEDGGSQTRTLPNEITLWRQRKGDGQLAKYETAQLIRDMVGTKKRRSNLFHYSTTAYSANETGFFLLVEEYRKTGSKGQASFLRDTYIKGDVVKGLEKVTGQINLNRRDATAELIDKISDQVNGVGLSMKDKIRDNGLLKAIELKMGNTSVDTTLFDSAQDEAAANIYRSLENYSFQLDKKYQPKPDCQAQVTNFRQRLILLKFDIFALGMW